VQRSFNIGAVAVALGCLLATAALARPAATASCSPSGELRGETVYYCGPGKAHLSVFDGVTFKRGTCGKQRSASGPIHTLKLGVRTQDAKHNDGRRYFGISITGRLSHPTNVGVIAYSNGKRWGGYGTKFDGDAQGGTFTVQGTNGSHGKAHGKFTCS